MKDIFGRNNIIKKIYDQKDVIIYEDHRTILNILWMAKKSRTLLLPPTIVCFDKHDDFKDPIVSKSRLAQINNSNVSKEEFWSFVEWEISQLDDDWIKTGMELNLIGDVILFGAEITPNVSGTHNIYSDQYGNTHTLYSVGHIWGGFSHQGWLVDYAQSYLYQPIWDLLGWQNARNDYFFDSNKRKIPLILDFDLDCFTNQLLEFVIPWREDIFLNLFTKRLKYDYTPQQFLIDLFRESTFTTIAKESECFSYVNDSALVLKYLNELLFNNYL